MKYCILFIAAFLACGASATYIEWGGGMLLLIGTVVLGLRRKMAKDCEEVGQ